MARIRCIKPEFWEDETVGMLSRDARLLFIGTWNLADDEGRLRWTEAYIKATIFMYDDDITFVECARLMNELVEAQVIRPYNAGKTNQRLAIVVNFRKHQTINRPGPSKLPAPPNESVSMSLTESLTESLSEPSVSDSLPEGKGVEGKGTGSGTRDAVAHAPGTVAHLLMEIQARMLKPIRNVDWTPFREQAGRMLTLYSWTEIVEAFEDGIRRKAKINEVYKFGYLEGDMCDARAGPPGVPLNGKSPLAAKAARFESILDSLDAGSFP